jgi:SPP1 gp7 family putative phage head morphogenesis protein
LKRFLKAAIVPENQMLAHHIAVTARNMIERSATEYMQKLSGHPLKVATAVARMNLKATDNQIAANIKRVLRASVRFPTPTLVQEPITETVRIPVGDAVPTILPPSSRRLPSFPVRGLGEVRPLSGTSTAEIERVMRQQIRNNVELIRSLPREYFDRLASDVYENIAGAKRWETLAEKLTTTIDYDGGITKSRADLIARDQTAKMNAAFNEERQTSVGISHYEWQTAGDERVRPTHADNEGKIFAWDDPPEETGHPGHDVNCRCVALAVLSEMAA